MGALILREKIIFIGIIALFLWISFFAPTVSLKWWFMPVSILSVLLLGFTKDYFKLIFCKEEVCFLTFLLTMGFGITSAKDLSIAYQHFWFFIFPAPFLYFFAKIAFKQKYGMAIIRSLCLTGSLVGIYGIIEFISKQNLIYDNLFYNFYYLTFIGHRIMSLHIHPAPLGTYLVAIFPLTLMLLVKEKKTIFKSLAIVYMAVIFMGIILTFSRGALFGFFSGMFVMIFYLMRQKKMVYIRILILLMVLIILLSSLLCYYNYKTFWRYSFEGIYRKDLFIFKFSRLAMLEKLIKDHPFFGVGFGHYRVLFDYYLPHLASSVHYDNKVADCMYMTILAETGVIGFGAFMLFLFLLFKRILIRLNSISIDENKIFMLAFFSGLIGIMGTFLTYDVLYWIAPSYLFWSYAGILSSLTD